MTKLFLEQQLPEMNMKYASLIAVETMIGLSAILLNTLFLIAIQK